MTGALKVFLSYAHEDETARADLGKYLRPLVRKGLIEIWHDRKITGGREWKGAIDAALKDADIILLLVSAEFLDSDYCNDVELAEASRMHEAGRSRVIPVILRTCPWRQSPLARFNALPPDGQPILEADHPAQRYTAVAEGISAVIEELRGSPPAEPASGNAREGGEQKTGGSKPPAKERRRIPIGKINLGLVEIGPFELAWPPRLGVRSALVGLGTLAVVAAAIYFVALRGPLVEAQHALRMARYDTALDKLVSVPGWLSAWPDVTAMRQKASLGTAFHKKSPDWESLGSELRRLRGKSPADADLMVLDATYRLRKCEDYENLRALAEAATRADERNAEAWYLLGLDRDLAGDAANAKLHYRKAIELAPDSPQYRSNLARALLDGGDLDDAIAEYQHISQFPLARLEQALGHWAKGDFANALGAQRDALKMLDDSPLMEGYYNRRAWMFRLAEQGVRLASLDDKRCYAQIEATASRRLGGDTATEFPPAACNEPPVEISMLVADDLCRFVDAPQPGLAEATARLRAALKQPAACPAPPAPPDRPSAKISQLQENMTWSID